MIQFMPVSQVIVFREKPSAIDNKILVKNLSK